MSYRACEAASKTNASGADKPSPDSRKVSSSAPSMSYRACEAASKTNASCADTRSRAVRRTGSEALA